jgi:hypothetical protein
MPAISAADAISPAIERTKKFLFNPFEWGTYLKLCLVAVVTEGLGGNFGGSSGSHSSGNGPVGPASSIHFSPLWIAVIVGGSLLLILLGVVVAYLITRLRFAFFHCLIHNSKEIRPGWRLYQSQAMRFFLLNLAVGFCFLLVVVLVALPFVAGFWRLFHDTPPGGRPDFALLLALILPLIPIFIVVVLAGIIVDLILRDLMMPHYALANATAGQAWAAVWSAIKAEKGQFFVYALLRLILPILAMIALFVILIIPGLLFLGVSAIVEVGIHSAFADATGAAAVAGICLQVFVGAVAIGLAMLMGICLGGPISTAVREYALIFYAGRYKALWEVLFPPPPLMPVTLDAPQIS